MNGDVITCDDDTLEVNINGQDYLGSSIVDILSYLTDKNSNDLFFTTGDYDITDRLMLGMPQNSVEEATDKILHYALKSRRQLFKHDDYDVQGAEVGKESEDEEFFDTSDV